MRQPRAHTPQFAIHHEHFTQDHVSDVVDVPGTYLFIGGIMVRQHVRL